MTSMAEALGYIDLVGPKGYEHGWHFVGIPAAGTKIRMPGGRLGTVIGGDHQHARIRTANGDTFTIPHDKAPGPARLLKHSSKPDPAPVPKLSPERMKMKLAADKSIAAGETLFHGTSGQFKVGDVIDAEHARAEVTKLHEGKKYAFASTDPGEATFAGKASRGGHVYRVVPVGKYEYDTHQGSATSRRTTGGFRVVEEVSAWKGEKMIPARVATAAERKAYVKTGKLPPGVTLHANSMAEQLGYGPIDLASGMAWLHELRDADGKWTRTPGAKPGTGLDRYKVPPHDRLISHAPNVNYPDPADYPFFKKHPVSVQNIIDAYDAVPQEIRPDGMTWYHTAHLLAKAMAHGNAEEGAILLANYSNSADWPINMFRAARVADEGKPIPKGQGYISGDQVRKAQKALDGMGIDQVLASPKQRSFAYLLAQGDDSPDDPYGHVVVDAHALNVAAGGVIRGATYHRGKKQRELAPEDIPPIGIDVRAHEYVGDLYREAASIISHRDGVLIKPHQMQAVTWVAQVLANQAQDRMVMEGGAVGGVLGRAKGRIANEVKDWKTWLSYAKAHHLPLIPGVSALAGQALFAQVLEMAGEDSLLAQLAWQPPPFDGLVSTLGAVALAEAWQHEPRDPHGQWTEVGGYDELGSLLEREFKPQQLDAARVRHPRSGYMVKAGLERRVFHPKDTASHGNESLGTEGPAVFEVTDHGDPHSPRYNSLEFMGGKKLGTEPVRHVYRGMSAEEWAQAQQRGYIESDRRGAISDLEGTNAAADPRDAVSYLPRSDNGVVAKIAVRPQDQWFTISADQYLRTRQQIPLTAVEHAVPFRKTGKHGGTLEVQLANCTGCGCPTDLAYNPHQLRVPKGMPGGGRWVGPVPFPNDLLGSPLDEARMLHPSRRISPPGETVAPGVKQLRFPGMPEPVPRGPEKVRRSLDKAISSDHEFDTKPGEDVTFETPGNNYFGNTADTDIVSFEDGSTWVRKRSIPEDSMHREIAYSRVSDVLGAGAPKVIERQDPQTGRPSIWMPYVDGQTAIEWTDGYDPEEAEESTAYEEYDDEGSYIGQRENTSGHDPGEMYYSQRGMLIGLADTITNVGDRHMGNWMIEHGEPVPIDNESASIGYGAGSGTPFAQALAEAIDGEGGYEPDRWKDPAQWDEWMAGLQGLEGEFDDLGMREQWQHLLLNFNEVRGMVGV